MSNPNQRHREHSKRELQGKISRMVREAKRQRRKFERDGQLELFVNTPWYDYLKLYDTKGE